jgi:CrcB protein
LKAVLIGSAVVGTGGFIGSLARYGVGGLVHRQLPLAIFPYGTLLVNLLGCLLIGVLAGLAESRQLFGPQFRQFALIGVLGGFTTFSSFGYETLAMLRDADYLRASANIGINVVGGLFLVWLGFQVVAAR